ncbi:MAG: hypothetical protein LQ350_002413 [Teloschistes chrysophthalmus]|nr:MAG: hypothetical protein LQ350_002413 [Niorma chrysophthalma]
MPNNLAQTRSHPGNEETTPFKVTESSIRQLQAHYGEQKPEFVCKARNTVDLRAGFKRVYVASTINPGVPIADIQYTIKTLEARVWDDKYSFWTIEVNDDRMVVKSFGKNWRVWRGIQGGFESYTIATSDATKDVTNWRSNELLEAGHESESAPAPATLFQVETPAADTSHLAPRPLQNRQAYYEWLGPEAGFANEPIAFEMDSSLPAVPGQRLPSIPPSRSQKRPRETFKNSNSDEEKPNATNTSDTPKLTRRQRRRARLDALANGSGTGPQAGLASTPRQETAAEHTGRDGLVADLNTVPINASAADVARAAANRAARHHPAYGTPRPQVSQNPDQRPIYPTVNTARVPLPLSPRTATPTPGSAPQSELQGYRLEMQRQALELYQDYLRGLAEQEDAARGGS